jgi:hypothetical protein
MKIETLFIRLLRNKNNKNKFGDFEKYFVH